MQRGTEYRMYNLEIKEEADKIFKKLAKKDKKRLKIIAKKISEIRKDQTGYKHLRKPLQGFNRVHIDEHFVLIFEINNKTETIVIWYFDHHDNVYDWKPKRL